MGTETELTRVELLLRAINRAIARLRNPDMGGQYVRLAREILEAAADDDRARQVAERAEREGIL